MNRNRAKLMTMCGIICCLFSAVLLFYSLTVKINVLLFIAALFFAAGIVLTTLSLAYYTDK
jgi:uncharacterized membrane protein HdeD (DUF308 family)